MVLLSLSQSAGVTSVHLFFNQVPLWGSGWPGTPYVFSDRDLPASASLCWN